MAIFAAKYELKPGTEKTGGLIYAVIKLTTV
jgi:hypothetical protein